MRFSLSLSMNVVVAGLLLSSAASVAQAQSLKQDSDVPTFKKELPPPIVGEPDEPETPALRPIAPPETSVSTTALPDAGPVKVVPPPPRVVTTSTVPVAVPTQGLSRPGGFTARAAASVTPLGVNSPFGWRGGRMHTGIDFQASYGDSVGASMSGTVVFAGVKHGYGNFIVVDHGSGIASCYAHLSAMYVTVGQAVTGGQLIGAVGTTGRSTGPHLHYEIRINGKPINPTSMISLVDGVVYVNGQPMGGADEQVAPAHVVDPAASGSNSGSRARRVDPTQGPTAPVVVYGDDSMTGY
jgi:murein DD-endopeptidase MepM/ murein hydrolase activator NlpD